MYISKILKKKVEYIYINNNTIYCKIKSKDLKLFMNFFKNNYNLQFKQLLDIWAEDYLKTDGRFVINYLFLSVKFNIRLILKISLNEKEGIDSLVSDYKSANWLEREVWDMFGIFFFNHNDLRRILTDYGFEGYPLRKDFPITGYTEVNYDFETKRILYTPLNLTQEIRSYIYLNPWIQN